MSHFGGTACHERVDDGGHDNDHQTKRQKTDIGSTQSFCTSYSNHFKDIGFIHHIDEDRCIMVVVKGESLPADRRKQGGEYPSTS